MFKKSTRWRKIPQSLLTLHSAFRLYASSWIGLRASGRKTAPESPARTLLEWEIGLAPVRRVLRNSYSGKEAMNGWDPKRN